MALLYHWEDENIAMPLINSFLKIGGSVTNFFGPCSNEYPLFRKRRLVLVATIQLLLSTRASLFNCRLSASAKHKK